MTCPRCGKNLMMTSTTDWDSLITYYYPQCYNCGYTTRRVFETPDSLQDYLTLRFPQLKEEK